jgi:hypothetical protein
MTARSSWRGQRRLRRHISGFRWSGYAILGGFKDSAPVTVRRIFIQALAGLSRQAETSGIQNGFIAQPGGGVEWPINARFNGRAFGITGFYTRRPELSRLPIGGALCLCSGGRAIPDPILQRG